MLDTSTHNLIPLIDNLNVDLYAANFAKKAVQKGTPYMTILIAILLIVYTLEIPDILYRDWKYLDHN